jgi:hypothetical protein
MRHNAYHKYRTLKRVLRAILRACVSKTLRDLHQNFDHISVFFLSARDGAGAEWVAIWLAPCEFKRFQVWCSAGLWGFAQNVDHWNAHDIEGHLEVYWKSPELLVVVDSEQFNGWQQLHDSYLNGYPDRNAMGFIQPKRILLCRWSGASLGRYASRCGMWVEVWRSNPRKWDQRFELGSSEDQITCDCRSWGGLLFLLGDSTEKLLWDSSER